MWIVALKEFIICYNTQNVLIISVGDSYIKIKWHFVKLFIMWLSMPTASFSMTDENLTTVLCILFLYEQSNSISFLCTFSLDKLPFFSFSSSPVIPGPLYVKCQLAWVHCHHNIVCKRYMKRNTKEDHVWRVTIVFGITYDTWTIRTHTRFSLKAFYIYVKLFYISSFLSFFNGLLNNLFNVMF